MKKKKYRIIKCGNYWWAEVKYLLFWVFVQDTMTIVGQEECELMLQEKIREERKIVNELTL